MSNIDSLTLKGCFLTSTLKEIEQIEALDCSSITASPEFKERIHSTIAPKPTPKRVHFPKRFTVIFVAAIIVSLTIMFAASATVRNAVVDFFVTVYDTFSELVITKEEPKETETAPSQNDIYPSTIEVEYKPAYIDENGFTQLDKIADRIHIFAVWTNGTEIIDMTQSIIDANDVTLDTESSSLKTATIDGVSAYYMHKNGIYLVYWYEHGYFFSISCDDSLGWEEVEKIVSSISPVTN
ncbi:MAG: DUF4367 domain-containing protein [Clostridia bacterium]|nr:DUF4367 domain-containing protein [Clostridia bacterium]